MRIKIHWTKKNHLKRKLISLLITEKTQKIKTCSSCEYERWDVEKKWESPWKNTQKSLSVWHCLQDRDVLVCLFGFAVEHRPPKQKMRAACPARCARWCLCTASGPDGAFHAFPVEGRADESPTDRRRQHGPKWLKKLNWLTQWLAAASPRG